MAGLGLSKSKGSATSNSIGEQFATSDQMSAGYQGSSSTSAGGSQQSSASNQAIAFEDLYKQIYGGAVGAGTSLADNPFLSDTANQLFTQGQGILGGLQGNDAGSEYLKSILSDNGNVDEQIGLLGQDITKFLGNNTLPGIGRSAGVNGTYGGSRSSIAEGMAVDSATQQFARGASDIRTADLNRKAGAASTLAGNNLQASQTGLGSLDSLYGLANQGFMSGLSPYAALSDILGGPTTLGSSVSSGTSFDEAISNAFGENVSSGTSNSYGYDISTSTQKNKSSGFSLGF